MESREGITLLALQQSKGDNTMYYETMRFIGGSVVRDYWTVSTPAGLAFLFGAYDYILPLGTRKPRKVAKENIKHAN